MSTPKMNAFLVKALQECEKGNQKIIDACEAGQTCEDPGVIWIDNGQSALDVIRRCDISEIMGGAKRWADGGQACIERHESNPKGLQGLLSRGYSMIRLALDYMLAAGDNVGLMLIARHHEPKNPRLALRAWTFVSVQQCTSHDRQTVLNLAKMLEDDICVPEDVKRICDAYAWLERKQDIRLLAEKLERDGRVTWSKIAFQRAEETDLPVETEVSIDS